jgi:hypothetical protein
MEKTNKMVKIGDLIKKPRKEPEEEVSRFGSRLSAEAGSGGAFAGAGGNTIKGKQMNKDIDLAGTGVGDIFNPTEGKRSSLENPYIGKSLKKRTNSV